MFEKATKLKLRFATPAGNITTEDLWDLPLTSTNGASLDGLAKSLNKEVKESAEESFVVKKTGASKTVELKFEIVKHVIGVKLDDIERNETAAANKAKKEKLLGIIEDKEDSKLRNTSTKKLRDMVADL